MVADVPGECSGVDCSSERGVSTRVGTKDGDGKVDTAPNAVMDISNSINEKNVDFGSGKNVTEDLENGDESSPDKRGPEHGALLRKRRISFVRDRDHWFWYSLPRAAKASLILVLVSTVLLIAYSITAVSLSSEDEEAHIATVIIIMSVFTLFATVDAIIYENTLQLVSSIILSALMLARVLWFIVTRPSESNFLPLKVIWGALIIAVQISFIITALISCRQFGWRLYSRLGVDFRRPDAKLVQRMALQANLFNTLIKLDFVFLVVVCALGINVSIEDRDSIDIPIFVVSICTFFLDLAITVFGLYITSSNRRINLIPFLDLLMPLSYSGPIAIIVLYTTNSADTANAGTSVIIAGCVFMCVRTCLWWSLHQVSGNIHMTLVQGRMTIDKDAVFSGGVMEASGSDPDLLPLQEGAWLGKPSPGNAKKKRFLQLSKDGSTLRWGWKKYVRMYYAQDITYCKETLSITITFILDPEIKLVFKNGLMFEQWKRGLDRIMVILFSPAINPEERHAKPPDETTEETANGLQPQKFDISHRNGPFSRLGSGRATTPLYAGEMLRQNTPSTDQMRRRQNMAAYLFGGISKSSRSPISWLIEKTTLAPNRRSGQEASRDEVQMVSVGIQADPRDLQRFSDQLDIKTDEQKTADIAAHYAAMLNFPEQNDNLHWPPAVNETHSSHNTSSDKPLVRDLFGSERRVTSVSSTGDAALFSLDSSKRSMECELVHSPKTPLTSVPFAVSVDVIDFESLKIGKLLGSGTEGDVHAAWYLESPVAVKRFNKVEDAAYEVGMYLAIGLHDNVVSLRALCQHDDDMYLIMEYCPRGTLDSMLHYSAPTPWDPLRLIPLVRAIARAIYHLHSRSILHRDLKPANILVGHGQTMKVGDFGTAYLIRNETADSERRTSKQADPTKDDVLQLVGTMQYAAPELVNPDLRSSRGNVSDWATKLDVWSFGVTLWEIIERKRPFHGLDITGIQSLWLNSPYQARLPPVKIPDTGPPQTLRLMRGLADLVDDCTRLDPDSRPSFCSILQKMKDLVSTS
eukprot:jgi/Picsp_1/5682/NSC_03041-R1_protein kinase domain containing protein